MTAVTTMSAAESVFGKYQDQMWPYRFAGQLHVDQMAGGVPTDPRKAEAWLRSKIMAPDDAIRALVADTMTERGVDAKEATEMVVASKHLNGFRFDDEGQLFIPGPNLKACLKEAVSVAANAGKITTKGWGNPDNANYKKGLKSWFPEHVFVIEDRLYLGVKEPTRIEQRFVHTRNGSGIQYEEIVEGADIEFTVESDHDFTDTQWAAIWTAAERLGLGASRSLGFGQFKVTRWEPVVSA